MKKFLVTSLSILPMLFLNAYASPLSLSLFQDGFSLLDKLFVFGLLIVLVGAALLVVAFLKPYRPKQDRIKSPFASYLKKDTDDEDDENALSFDDSDEADDIDDSVKQDEEFIAEQQDELLETDDESDIENNEEEIIDSIVEPEEEDGTIYPKLILTHVKTNDFLILPLFPETKVGRNNENDLVLNDVTISGLHCRILNEDGNVYVQDENSTNGTFINDERLTGKTQLHHGDRLGIGKQEYNVSITE